MQRIYLSVVFIVFISTFVNSQEYRTINGQGNNIDNPTWGMENGELIRTTSVNYKDGVSELHDDKPNARVISNRVFDQPATTEDIFQLSDFVWVFGQFLDHDLSKVGNSNEPVLVIVPEDDEWFLPGAAIALGRSEVVAGTGVDSPRQYKNKITAFIDGSNVYGSNQETADYLRSFSHGKLRVSTGDLLPWNTTTGEFNDPKDGAAPAMDDDTHSGGKLYVAGDSRANENPLLTAMHTLFMREHNRICGELVLEHPNWSDETLYQTARKEVGAILQAITYYEWLPVTGLNIEEYSGYKPDVNPNITNLFSAAAFRVGHTLINSDIIRMDNNGDELSNGNISLRDAFFNPIVVSLAGGIDPYLIGMATQVQQKMDNKIVDDVRNFLFGPPGSGGGLDLAAINIARGRERGVADYNQLRAEFDLEPYTEFSQITSDPEALAALQSVYTDIDKLDAWVGMLSEEPMPNMIYGELLSVSLMEQFRDLRDGDRFYFENDDYFSEDDIARIKATTMQDVIMRNTDIDLMQDNCFGAMDHTKIPKGPGPTLPAIHLESSLYPNPVENQTILKVYSESEYDLSIRIMDIEGKIVQTIESNVVEGDNFIKLDINPTMSTGVYNLLIETGLRYSIVKMVKK